MVGKVLCFTVILWMVYAFFLLDSLRFLAPYKRLILAHHAGALALYGVLVFVNLFGGLFLAYRAVLLKDTGRKLALVEKRTAAEESFETELDVEGERP